MDLTTIDPVDGLPWDFDKKVKRERARELLMHQRPTLLIGSVMCTAYCQWQAINSARNPTKAMEAKTRAGVHLRFVCQLYEGSWQQAGTSCMSIQPGPAHGLRSVYRTSWLWMKYCAAQATSASMDYRSKRVRGQAAQSARQPASCPTRGPSYNRYRNDAMADAASVHDPEVEIMCMYQARCPRIQRCTRANCAELS